MTNLRENVLFTYNPLSFTVIPVVKSKKLLWFWVVFAKHSFFIFAEEKIFVNTYIPQFNDKTHEALLMAKPVEAGVLEVLDVDGRHLVNRCVPLLPQAEEEMRIKLLIILIS